MFLGLEGNMPMKKQELKLLTEKWLKKHDPLLRYKKSPLYKKRQKIKLARTKASKQAKLQKRQLRKLGL
jgi:hypothetical protein